MTADQGNYDLQVDQNPGESPEAIFAQTMLRPTVLASASIKQLSGERIRGVNLQNLSDELSNQVAAVNEGDMDRGVAMLVAQSHTLDAIFHATIQRAILNMGHYPDVVAQYMKLALKAQSQCRATWEAVSAIKHPPMMGYVKQANIAQGHQQVNNIGEKVDNAPTELLDEQNGERLDSGTTGATSGVDKALETVDALNRT